MTTNETKAQIIDEWTASTHAGDTFKRKMRQSPFLQNTSNSRMTTPQTNMNVSSIRGYFGLAFYEPKTKENIGTAVRSAHCFGADFLAVIGKRYKRTPADTMATERHIPIYEYADLDDFKAHIPKGCDVFIVEVDGQGIQGFEHPERCIYLMGGEDRTVPPVQGWPRISFPTSHCLNMAMAATLICYDRVAKGAN